MGIVYVVIMLLALAGMIVCNKKQNVVAAAKPLAMVLLLVVIGSGVMLLQTMDVFGGGHNKTRENETAFYASQGAVAGEYIKNNLGGGKVLLIGETSYSEDPMFAALKKNFETYTGGEVVAATISLPNQQEEMYGAPLSEMMTSKDFDAVIEANSDAQVVVSLIGLPRDASANLKVLRNAMAGKGPKLVLLGGTEMPGIGSALKAGAISAIITIGPDAVFNEDKAPKDPKAAFKVRYVLIDKANVDQYASQLGM